MTWQGTLCRHAVLLLLSVMLLAPGLTSCDLDDSRDACCRENMLHFRYFYLGSDCFGRYISTVRYFLFDCNGAFLREMPPVPTSSQDVDISSLTPGDYTVVAVGNLFSYATLTDFDHARADGSLTDLARFRLKVTRYSDAYPSMFAGGDPLYWGEKSFTVAPQGKNFFIGELSNVHCCFTVKVVWDLTPPYPDGNGFSYHLSDVGCEFDAGGAGADHIGIHSFPVVAYAGCSSATEASFASNALIASTYTLRWSREHIPVFSLWRYGERVTKDVDIAMLFRKWNVKPWLDEVQNYSITIRITAGGSIVVSYGADASVKDWQDGGSLG